MDINLKDAEPFEFANDKEREKFGLHIIAQVRYHTVMMPYDGDYFHFETWEACKKIFEDCASQIRGEYEAILEQETTK